MNNKLSSFKSLFFNETASKDDETQAVTSAEPKVSAPQTVFQVQTPSGSNNLTGIIVPDIFNAFNQILDDFNLPGPDYLEVKKASEALKSAIPDENTRLLAAVATVTATSSALNKQVILDSIEKYIERIQIERKESENEFKQLYDSEITTRQKEVSNRKENIDGATKQITELQTLIARYSEEINTLSGEMQAKQIELDIKKKNFDATVDAFIAGLQSDKAKFETLMK